MAAEKQFENKVKKFLEEEDCYFIKHFSNAFTKSGIPDILASVGGYFVGIEIKAEKGKPSPLQIHNLQQIHLSGGFAILLYPDDFELFKKFIQEITTYDDYSTTKYYLELKKRWCDLADKL